MGRNRIHDEYSPGLNRLRPSELNLVLSPILPVSLSSGVSVFRNPTPDTLISHKVFIKSFGKSQFSHKFVNLLFIVVIIK